jgi:hypothetical protein
MRRAPSDSPGIPHDWTCYCGDSATEKAYYCTGCKVLFTHRFAVTPDLQAAVRAAGMAPYCPVEPPTKRPNIDAVGPAWGNPPRVTYQTNGARQALGLYMGNAPPAGFDGQLHGL